MTAMVVRAELNGGRYISGDRHFQTRFNLGMMSFNEGYVRETRRAYDNEEGPPAYEAYLSNYTLEELGLDENYMTFGLGIEQQWKYLTFQFSGKYSNPQADAVAHMHPTASPVPPSRMGYYIGVDEVKYKGKTYDYMMIPENQKFSADIQSYMLEMAFLFTPFSINTFQTHWTPWLRIGLLGIGGSYEIDAGPAKGVVQYEIPPKDYVVCGKGTGWGAVGTPEIGFGGEAKFFWFETVNGDAELSIQGDYSMMELDGSPGSVGLNLETTRNVDFDYSRWQLALVGEIPISKTSALVLGLTYQNISAEVKLDSVHRSEAEQKTYSEKYDKEGKLGVSEWMLTIGLKF
ncbi:MAG: hypothetical protein V1791_00165 [Pseudomonadota bacterium]